MVKSDDVASFERVCGGLLRMMRMDPEMITACIWKTWSGLILGEVHLQRRATARMASFQNMLASMRVEV